MPADFGERVARNEQRLEDLTGRLRALEQELEEVSSRNRKTEWAVKLIVDAQRNAQDLVKRRQNQILVRVNVLIGVCAVAAIAVSIITALVH